jgi:hypothetical protein
VANIRVEMSLLEFGALQFLEEVDKGNAEFATEIS